jgi:hypothetical protein
MSLRVWFRIRRGFSGAALEVGLKGPGGITGVKLRPGVMRGGGVKVSGGGVTVRVEGDTGIHRGEVGG